MMFEIPAQDGKGPGKVSQVPGSCTYLMAPRTWIQREVRYSPGLATLCLP